MKEVIQLTGQTARFSGNGRGLGYPTANIQTSIELDDGVYLGRASLATFNDHPALVFVGIPTTVGDKERRVETHLLDIPDEDYHDLPLRVDLIYYVRPNETFSSVDDLRAQMKADEVYARDWFKYV